MKDRQSFLSKRTALLAGIGIGAAALPLLSRTANAEYVPSNKVPVGRGAGVTGYNSAVLPLSITRAQIPTITITTFTTFSVSGFSTAGDLGAGAIYTTVGASPSGPMAIQDAAGTWLNLVITMAPSVGWFGATGDGVTDDTAAIQAAHDAALAVVYPNPSVQFNITTIALRNGASVIGTSPAERAIGTGTKIFASTSAFAFIQTSNDAAGWIGAIFSNVNIYCQNGIKFDGTVGALHFPSLRRVSLTQSGATVGKGIYAINTVHLEVCEDGEIQGFDIAIDGATALLSNINNLRLAGHTTSAVRLDAGCEDTIIYHNDFVNCHTGATCFVDTTANTTIRSNYMEQTVAEGTGLTAAIVVRDGPTILIVEDNNINMPIACAPNWLNVTATVGHMLTCIVTGNTITSSGTSYGPATFNSGTGMILFASGGNTRTSCVHFGNSSEAGFPYNTTYKIPPGTPDVLSVMTPALFGCVNAAHYGASAKVLNDYLVIPPAGTPNQTLFIDPNISLTGTLSVYVRMAAAGAGNAIVTTQDNGVFKTTATLALTTTPTWYKVANGQAYTTNCWVLPEGMAATHDVYVYEIVVRQDTTTAALFADKTSNLNTVGKYAGKMAWSSDGLVPVWATGSTDVSTWIDGTGAVVYTPV